MTKFTCWDESGHEVVYEAATAEDAAQEYVGDGDYYLEDKTIWINIYVSSDEDGDYVETVKVAVHPEDPTPDDEEWEYTGCQGEGGGVACFYQKGDWVKITSNWAQDLQDGVQGLESVRYENQSTL